MAAAAAAAAAAGAALAASVLPAVSAVELQKKLIKNAVLPEFSGDPHKCRVWDRHLDTYLSQIQCSIGRERDDVTRAAAYLAAGTSANRKILEQVMLYDSVFATFSKHKSLICSKVRREDCVYINRIT